MVSQHILARQKIEQIMFDRNVKTKIPAISKIFTLSGHDKLGTLEPIQVFEIRSSQMAMFSKLFGVFFRESFEVRV